MNTIFGIKNAGFFQVLLTIFRGFLYSSSSGHQLNLYTITIYDFLNLKNPSLKSLPKLLVNDFLDLCGPHEGQGILYLNQGQNLVCMPGRLGLGLGQVLSLCLGLECILGSNLHQGLDLRQGIWLVGSEKVVVLHQHVDLGTLVVVHLLGQVVLLHQGIGLGNLGLGLDLQAQGRGLGILGHGGDLVL